MATRQFPRKYSAALQLRDLSKKHPNPSVEAERTKRNGCRLGRIADPWQVLFCFSFRNSLRDVRKFAEGSKRFVTGGMDAAGVLAICLTGRDGTSIH